MLVGGVGPNEKPPAGLLKPVPVKREVDCVVGVPKEFENAVVPVAGAPNPGWVPKAGADVLAPNRVVPAVVAVFCPNEKAELLEPKLNVGLFWLLNNPILC